MDNNIKKAQENAHIEWDKHIKGGYLIYPNEYLTRFIFSNRKKFKSILDYGCGDGRHLEMMNRAGISKLIGIDCSLEALQIAKNRCPNCELHYIDENMNLLSLLKDEKVDCIVCWGIAHINLKHIISKILLDFSKILNQNGVIICNWRTQKDSLFKHGKEIEPNTFIIDKETHKEFLYYFPNLDEIKEIYKNANLEILSIDHEEFSINNEKTLNSFYIIQAKKAKS